MERLPGRLAIVERERASTAIAPAASRTAIFVRAALLTGLLAVAYRYSWLTLVRSPSGSLVGATIAAILAGAVLVRGRNPLEPGIDDRYTDFIVGVPLVASALAIVLLLPFRLSVFFWFWRLDLLSIPLFVGGAIALLFGIRIFWRFRLAVVSLFLLWLLENSALVSLATIAALTAGLALGILIISRRQNRGVTSGRRLAVDRPAIATVLLIASAVAATVANGAMDRFQPLLRDNGQPRAMLTSDRPSATGWTAERLGGYDWIRSYVGPDASWNRYALSRPSTRPLLVDVISSRQRKPVANATLADLYRLHGSRLEAQRDVNLGDGVVGRLVTYVDAARSQWNALYWDWPIESSGGIRYERVVVSGDQATEATGPLIDLAGTLVAGSAR